MTQGGPPTGNSSCEDSPCFSTPGDPPGPRARTASSPTTRRRTNRSRPRRVLRNFEGFPSGARCSILAIMHGLTCDRCGANLLVNEAVRYVARLEVVAAYDPPEMTREDLARDHEAEMRRLVKSMEGRDAKDIEEEVAAVRRFDLCPPCRVVLLGNPSGGTASTPQ